MKASVRVYRVVAVLIIAFLLSALVPPPRASAEDTAWWGAYFDNRYLAGMPRWVRWDPQINFNWGAGVPDGYLPADNFSVRWKRMLNLEAGRYRFSVTADDGVRLYINGKLLIDQWLDQSASTYVADVDLPAGNHSIQMDYYENGGLAEARLSWQYMGPVGQPSSAWRGEYFSNRWLSGAPVFVRDDIRVSFDWGWNAPDYRLPGDNFSVRWTRSARFEAGRYRFTVVSDDGVRLFVDNRLLIDRWYDMARTTHRAEIELSAGVHVLRLEYYDRYEVALAQLSWDAVSIPPAVGNIVTCVRPWNSWIKVYRWENSRWVDVNANGWGASSASGYLKIDGMQVDPRYGDSGHPYRVELWANGRLVRAVGNTAAGQGAFRVYPGRDNATPWGCPAP